MATKSFESEFTFNAKSASALANALNSTKKVNLAPKKPINYYKASERDKMKKRFDSVFLNKSE